jgi:TolA-binding protein
MINKPSPYLLPLAAALAALQLAGCAYFNTYYNAKKLYDSASGNRPEFPDTAVVSAGERNALQQAADKFAKVASSYPQSRWAPASLFYMGNAYRFMGETEKALRKYQEVWQFYPQSKQAPQARLNAMVLNYRIADYPEALAGLEALRNSSDRGIREKALFLEAEIAQTQSAISDAAILWQRFLFTFPKSWLAAKARHRYAQCLVELGEIKKAVHELEILTGRRNPKQLDLEAKMLLARCYTLDGQTEKALKLYNQLLKRPLQPGQAALTEFLKSKLLAPQQTQSQTFNLYRDLSMKYPQTQAAGACYLAMAGIMEDLRDLDSAQVLYKKACEDKKENLNHPELAGIRDRAMKRLENITRLSGYRRELSPEAGEQNAKLEFLMAEHYLFSLGQPDSAVSLYLQVAAGYPSSPLAPKALLAAAWAEQFHLGDSRAADSLRRVIIGRYPLTRYANASRLELGLEPDPVVSDSEPEIEFKLKSQSYQPSAPIREEKPGPQSSDSTPPPSIPGPSKLEERSRSTD